MVGRGGGVYFFFVRVNKFSYTPIIAVYSLCSKSDLQVPLPGCDKWNTLSESCMYMYVVGE